MSKTPKQYSIAETKERLASLIKSRIEDYSEELRQLRAKELSKSEKDDCLLCDTDSKGCKCLAKSGLEAKKSCGIPGKLKKGDVPTAKAPTKAGSASHPTAKVGSPVVGAAPKTPVMKSERLRLPGQPLSKALPQDPNAKLAMNHAAVAGSKAAATPAPAPAAAAAKPTADEHTARHAQYADFTPAGAFTVPNGGASAGEMKPAATAALKPPTPAARAIPKAMGTSAAPTGGVLARFSAALKGAPAMKSEISLTKSLGSCLLCGHGEHAGDCK